MNNSSFNEVLSEKVVNKSVESRRSPKTQRDQRSLAFQLYYCIDRSSYEISLEELIVELQREYNIEIEANSFALSVVTGALEHGDELEKMVEPKLKNWELNRLSCAVRMILKMALFEMFYLKIPGTIVINEYLEITKGYAEKGAHRIINGILDQISKEFFN